MESEKLNIWQIIKTTFKDWSARNVNVDAASLAYNAIFSIPGLLIIIIWIAGNFFGEEAVRGEITRYVGSIMGHDVGKSLEDMVVSGMVDKKNVWMKTFGVLTLIFGSTTLFFQLQKSLNKLWDVEATPKKAWQKYILDRANSFGMILIIAFLLLVTLLLSSFLGLASNWIVRYFGLEAAIFAQIINILIGFVFTALLFAFMFKVLPDVEISWKSVWMGAFVTAALFTIGKFLLTFYFNTFKPTSTFGAAGTIILVMLWVNYTCQLIFLGAEFTKVYSKAKGYSIKPSRHAKWAPQMVAGEKADAETVPGVDPIPQVDHSQKSTKDSLI